MWILRIQFLCDCRHFFGMVFKIEPIKGDEILPQVHLTCLDIGCTNISKRELCNMSKLYLKYSFMLNIVLVHFCT